jgi:hypothetical protein
LALDKSKQFHKPTALLLGTQPPVSIEQEAEGGRREPRTSLDDMEAKKILILPKN